jgi:hypothetical protein
MGTAAPTATTRPGTYEIPRPGGRCAVSGEAIEPGDKFTAAVRETPTGLERLDVRPEHWKSFDHNGLLAFWQATMPQPGHKKKVFVDDETLCTLFERLADVVEPAKVGFRFVLGLILMRKRLLSYEGAKHDADRDIWIVRLRGREDRLELIDPKLDESQVGDVSQQLGEVLNQEL